MSSDVNVQKKPSGTKAETKCCEALCYIYLQAFGNWVANITGTKKIPCPAH